jgi:predicted enzyme related to lactoylglutathione lyase
MPARKKASRKSSKKSSARGKKKSATRKSTASKKRPASKKRSASSKRPVSRARASKPAARRSAPARQAAPPSIPSGIGMRSHHFDYTTHDIDAVKRFYVDLLGFKNHEHDPQFNYLWVQTGNTSSLGFMPPMQGMGEMSPPKEPTLYFMVDDVDRAYANLSAKGMMFEGPPADMAWGHRVVRTTDPEGRPVMLATRKQT